MDTNGEPYSTNTPTNTRYVRHLHRLTVAQAAERLGITQDAVRQRIRRDTIRHEKDESGRVYVYLNTTNDSVRDGVQDGVRDELLEELRDRVRYLEEESRRKDSIILTMAQRIPELEAPIEPRNRAETASNHRAGGDDSNSSQEQAQHRSWLHRFFFGS